MSVVVDGWVSETRGLGMVGTLAGDVDDVADADGLVVSDVVFGQSRGL